MNNLESSDGSVREGAVEVYKCKTHWLLNYVSGVVFRFSQALLPLFLGSKPQAKACIYETVQTALNGVDMYNWFAKDFGDINSFENPRLGPFYAIIMGSFMAFMVQLFFCYRIWIINRAIWWLCLVIAAISGSQVVAGFIGGVQAHLSSDDVTEHHDQTVLVYMWLVGDAVADVMIAVTMTLCLVRAMANVSQQTNAIVYRIIRLTMETNALSAGIAVLSIILYGGKPNDTYYITPTLVLGKLYANTLLVTFNNRAFLQMSPGGPMSSSHASTRVITFSSNIPFGAGLRFDDPMVTTTESHGVTITNQTRTLGDAEIMLDSLHQIHADKHNHL
ncbi:hypothetical protein C0995_012579 [Termitomyces sp. Mi166|nr:hypothetical protein C0995_012579 [Termitomyces sp. Mi166\